MSARSEAKKQAKSDAAREWQKVSALPGVHLNLRKSRFLYLAGELQASDGSVWSTWHTPRFSGPVYCAKGETFKASKSLAKDRGGWEAVDSTGVSVLTVTGRHYNRSDNAVVTLGGIDYRFPVKAPGGKPTATMSAVEVDEQGRRLIAYRIVPATWSRGSRESIDVVVSPEAISIPRIELLVTITARFLIGYFDRPG